MLLILSDRNEQCGLLRRKLAVHFLSDCICTEHFKMKALAGYPIGAIVLDCTNGAAQHVEIVEKIGKKYKDIPLVVYGCDNKEYSDNFTDSAIILDNDLGSLIESLNKYGLPKPDRSAKMRNVRNYTYEDIRNIGTASDVWQNLHISERKSQNEYYLKYGISLRDDIGNIRFLSIENDLSKVERLGHYIILSDKYGYSSLSSLENFIHRRNGKSIRQWHEELLARKEK